jgi:outer membrane immunogenic protein
MKIFKLIAAVGAVGVIAGIGVASAADLPVKAPPPIAPVPTWTGCYIGANGGWGFGRSHDSLAPAPTAASQAFWDPAFLAGAAPSHFNYDTSGGIAGIQGGCNNQIGQLVLGAEADLDWANIRGSDAFTTSFPPAFVPGAFSSGQNLNWLGTIRGRFGYTPTSQWLFYVTGGIAFGQVGYNLAFAFPGSNDFHGISSTNMEAGWTIGVGTEWAFTNNWSVKAEYLYVDMSNSNQMSFPAGRAANLATNLIETFQNRYNIVRVGINYKFNSDIPVVAKY